MDSRSSSWAREEDETMSKQKEVPKRTISKPESDPSIHQLADKLKKHLENNKIFFDVIASLFLALMSLIISIVGMQINMRNEITNQRQLEIAENDREPYFTIECATGKEQYNGYDFTYTKDLYTITNKGGLITGAYIFDVDIYAEIQIYNTNSNSKELFRVCFDGLSEKTEGIISLYNSEKKEFSFYKYQSEKFDLMINDLRNKIKQVFSSSDGVWIHEPQVNLKYCVELEYINYKNTEYYQCYEFMSGDRLVLLTAGTESEKFTILGRANIEESVEDVSSDVCKIIADYIKTGSLEQQRIPLPAFRMEEYKADALSWAKKAISTFSYSREALIQMLSQEYPSEAVTYAVDNCGADWNEQAVNQAKIYISMMGYSYIDLVDALEIAEKFTHEQAVFGADNCGADWNKQAVWVAESILLGESKQFSKDELIEQLKKRGFTHEQAVYGVEHKHLF